MDFLAEVILSLFKLIIDGTKALINMKKEVREKLVRVYLEVLNNKSVLENSGYQEISPLNYDNKVFISIAKQLKNTEISPLYKFKKKESLFQNRKKEIERRKTQYAVNYIITNINDLKNITKAEKSNKTKNLRIKVRLNTLYKHLDMLDKVLSPVGKKL